MSDYPHSWRKAPIRDLIQDYVTGPSPDCEERTISSSEEWGVLKTTAITWSGWDEAAHKVLPRAYWGLKHLQVQRDDVLVTKAGPRHRVAVTCRVDTDPSRIIVSGKMIGLRPRVDRVEPRILASLIGQPDAQKFIHDRTTGMAESQVNFANGALLDAEVCLPPRHEQSKIAEILDTLDEAIRGTEAVVAKLKAMKQGLLHDLLTRGIDANGDLRPPVHEAPHLYHETPLGRLPKGWEVATVAQVARYSAIGPFGSDLVAADYRDEGVPVVFVRDIKPDRFLWKSDVFLEPQKAKALSAHRVTAGDVVATKMGFPPCIAAVYPEGMEDGIITADVVLVRVRAEIVLGPWLSISLNSPRVQRQVDQITAGVTRPKVTLRDVRNLMITLPTISEQNALLARVSALDDEIRQNDVILTKLRLQKSGLMDDLLTGRVSVTPLL